MTLQLPLVSTVSKATRVGSCPSLLIRATKSHKGVRVFSDLSIACRDAASKFVFLAAEKAKEHFPSLQKHNNTDTHTHKCGMAASDEPHLYKISTKILYVISSHTLESFELSLPGEMPQLSVQAHLCQFALHELWCADGLPAQTHWCRKSIFLKTRGDDRLPLLLMHSGIFILVFTFPRMFLGTIWHPIRYNMILIWTSWTKYVRHRAMYVSCFGRKQHLLDEIYIQGSIMWMSLTNASEHLLIEAGIAKGAVHPNVLALLHSSSLRHLRQRWGKVAKRKDGFGCFNNYV